MESFKGQRIIGKVYKNKDFSGADFSGAELVNVTFRKCDFRGADFRGLKLEGTKFEDCLFDIIDPSNFWVLYHWLSFIGQVSVPNIRIHIRITLSILLYFLKTYSVLWILMAKT